MADSGTNQRTGAQVEQNINGRDEQDDFSEGLDEDATPPTAPRYPISHRRLTAVEVPAIVQDVDRAIKAFGRHSALSHVSN